MDRVSSPRFASHSTTQRNASCSPFMPHKILCRSAEDELRRLTARGKRLLWSLEAADTTVSLARWKQGEQAVAGVGISILSMRSYCMNCIYTTTTPRCGVANRSHSDHIAFCVFTPCRLLSWVFPYAAIISGYILHGNASCKLGLSPQKFLKC